MARQHMSQPQPNVQQQFSLNGGMQPMQQGFDASHPGQMPPNFPGNGMTPHNMQRLQAALQASRYNNATNGPNNPLLQALNGSNPSVMSRQLELMGLAQNQQPQNGPINNLAPRMNSQPLHTQSRNMGGQPMNQPPGIFPPTPQVSQASPIPLNAQVGPSGMLPQQQQPVAGVNTSGPSNVKQLLSTMQTVKNQIVNEEQKMNAILRSNQPDGIKLQQQKPLLQKLTQLKHMLSVVTSRIDLVQKEQGLPKCVSSLLQRCSFSLTLNR